MALPFLPGNTFDRKVIMILIVRQRKLTNESLSFSH